ncbi:MAG: response regulator [Bacteroidota bacterium]
MAAKTILIAEDEVEIRELMAMLFENEGITVYKAPDGQAALDMLGEHRTEINLLVTDLGLPKLGGIELIHKAKQMVPSLKILAASGYSHSDMRAELAKEGVAEFFPKPFSPVDLLAAAKRLLGMQ